MIKNICLLTKISIKNILERMQIFDNENKKINKKSIYFWFIIIIVCTISYISNELINVLQEYSQLDSFLDIFFALMTTFIVMQTIVLSMNLLYFAQDVENLLQYPIKPLELLISRINTIVIVLYGTECVFAVIPLILYGITSMMGIVYYLESIFILILLPIFSTIIISILTLVILNLIKKIKNKNAFQLVTVSILSAVIILGEFIFIKICLNDSQEIEKTLMFVCEYINRYFIILKPIVEILKQENILRNIIKIGIVFMIIYGVFMFLGQKYYIKNILKTTVYIKKAKTKKIFWHKQCRQDNIICSYIKNDIKSLSRNIVFFIQTIYPICLILILAIAIVLVVRLQLQQYEDINNIFSTVYLNMEGVSIILVILQILFSIPNISLTAISRQRENAVFMKYIPISFLKQYYLKNVLQCGINILTSIVILALIKFIFVKITVMELIMLFILGGFLSIVNSKLMLIVDIKKPILNWKNETEIMKQNPNKIFQYIWNILIFVLMMYMKKALKNISVIYGSIVIIIVFALFDILINRYVKKQLNKNTFFNRII